MRAMPLPECLGTVVVHRNDVVTCTKASCPRDVSLDTWFGFHSLFVSCSTDDCSYCRFHPSVLLGHGDGDPTSSSAARRRGRLLEPAFRHRSSS
jgi:hypothetical protein